MFDHSEILYLVFEIPLEMPQIHVIDLFCGCGGFSEGARQAGANVLLAVDAWEEAMDVHKANHPDAIHLCQSLGGDVDEFAMTLCGFIELNVGPEDYIHIHGSPPCQSLSSANHSRNEDQGMSLVNWYLDLIDVLSLCTRPFTWSMEQVSNPLVLEIMEKRGGMLVNMSHYNVPQTRKRILIGNLDWDKVSESADDSQIPSLAQIMNGLPYKPPQGMTAVTSNRINKDANGKSLKNADGTGVVAYRGLDRVCSTITGGSPAFYDPIRHKRTKIPLQIARAIQTFPTSYNFDCVQARHHRQLVANAVPPAFSALLMLTIETGR